jgi:hypothetical protein
MTATLDAPATDAPKVVTSGNRMRFYSPDAQRLVWKAWGEMTPAEQVVVREKYPSAVPEDERSGDVGRYSDLIEYYSARLQQAQEVVRTGRDGVERGHAAGAIPEFRMAIEVLREAETIEEPADAWFAVVPGEFKTRIPPRLSGPYMNDMDPGWIVKTQNHVTRLSNPIHIAWMRRQVRDGNVNDRYVFEKELDPARPLDSQSLYPCIDTDSGELIVWATRDEFHRGVAAKRFRE